jgi:hypothetical protein
MRAICGMLRFKMVKEILINLSTPPLYKRGVVGDSVGVKV